jgi:opacity protein-like surface antigen
MKRLLIAFILIICVNLGKAQIANHALGLRLGGGNGVGTELSYQHGWGDLNRLEFDLGITSGRHYSAWGLTGMYQWVWNIDDGFNWYAGAGARIGSWDWDNGWGNNSSGAFLAAAGNIGIEYAFPIGIQLSLDARPAINLINSGDSFNNSIAFGIRYQF